MINTFPIGETIPERDINFNNVSSEEIEDNYNTICDETSTMSLSENKQDESDKDYIPPNTESSVNLHTFLAAGTEL